MSLGPFDLTGGPFLMLYGVLLAMTIVAGLLIPRWLRPAGNKGMDTNDADELAYLAGGSPRFTETVVARLLAAGALGMSGGKDFHPRARDRALSTAERSVVALAPPIGWREIAGTLKAYAQPVEQRLAAAGLVMDEALIAQMRFWQTLPYALLIAFGSIKLLVGEARDKPVAFLTMLLLLTTVLAIIRWCVVDRRTRAGRAALARAEQANARLKAAPTTPEIALGVALFGTVVLDGSEWSPFHQLRNPSGDGGSGGGADGSSGGDGGGGGCGGCGG